MQINLFLGGGTLFVLDISPEGRIFETATYEWSDGIFDVVWSETHPDVLVAASGDGILHVWNSALPQVGNSSSYSHEKGSIRSPESSRR